MTVRYCSNCGQDVTDDMRFCPRCLAPLKTTAVPVSVVTLSDPYPVGTRQTPFLTVSALLVGAAAFYVCWIFGSVYHLPIIPALTLTIIGVVGGVLVSHFYTSKQLRILEEKGEIRTSLKLLLGFMFLAVGVILFCVLLLVYFALTPSPVWYLAFNLLYSLASATCVTRAFLFVQWEKKHKKEIYEKNRSMFVFPKNP